MTLTQKETLDNMNGMRSMELKPRPEHGLVSMMVVQW